MCNKERDTMNIEDTQAAQQVVTQLAQGDFAAVEQRLAGNIRQQLPAERLQATWQALETQVGSFKEQLGADTFQVQSTEMIIVTCAFAMVNLDVNVSFNSAGEISGLTITPVGSVEQQLTSSYEPPAYVKLDSFKEQEVQVGQVGGVMPGILNMPVGKCPFAPLPPTPPYGPTLYSNTT